MSQEPCSSTSWHLLVFPKEISRVQIPPPIIKLLIFFFLNDICIQVTEGFIFKCPKAWVTQVMFVLEMPFFKIDMGDISLIKESKNKNSDKNTIPASQWPLNLY